MGRVPALAKVRVRPVLCLESDEEISTIAGEVLVCSTANLCALLISRPQLLDELAWAKTSALVRGTLRPAATEVSTAPLRRLVDGWRHRNPARKPVRLGVELVLLAVLVAGVLTNLDWITHGIRDRLMPVVHPLGARVLIDGENGRPTLAVTAVDVRTVTARQRRAAVPKGHRLVGLQVRVQNVGEQPLSFRPESVFRVRGLIGASVHPRAQRVAIRSGRLLPATLSLAPGQRASGYLIFEVPDGARLDRVYASFESGLDDSASWEIEQPD